jgi:predicted nucleic acid-binding protein
VIALARQEITLDWWDRYLGQYRVVISDTVIHECGQGDPLLSRKRLRILKRFPVLPLENEVESYAEVYLAEALVPNTNPGDALHLAFASVYAVDYLATWNFKHLANAVVRQRLRLLNCREGLPTPLICTPEELMGE